MKDKVRELVEKEMDENDLKFLSNKDELINEITKRYCRNCHLKNKCGICKTVREEVREKLKEEVGERNLK